MTKEEKIKEAWGATWHELPPEQQECAYKYNGWVSHSEYRLGYSQPEKMLVIKLDRISKQPDSWLINDQFYFRPKSLTGIEKNNGWIKVEPFKNLEFCNEEMWVKHRDGSILSLFASKNYLMKRCTHYQKLVAPEPPIY